MNTKILFGLCIFLLALSPAYAWDDTDYAYRMPINTSGATITDYQLGFNFTKPTNMEQNNFNDMAFYTSSGIERPYWIEDKVDGSWAYVWLKGNFTISDADIEYYVYYSNATMTSKSNGSTTMIQWHGSATSNYIDDLIIEPVNIIFETRARVTSATHQTEFSISNNLASSDDKIYFQPYSASNIKYIVNMDEGAIDYETPAPTLTTNQWYDIKFILNSTGTTFYQDGVQVGTTITTKIPDENLGLSMRIVTGTAEQEYSFVRKYNANVPIITFGAEETPNFAPSITINKPANSTYYTTSIPLNITVSEIDSASFWCAIYNDGVLVTNETTNTTYTTTLTKTGGSHNVSVTCEDSDSQTSTDTEYYYVFMGLNVSAFNGGNASALTSWNIYATNGTFNYSDTGLSNPTLIDIVDLPTGSTNIIIENTGYGNATYTRTLNNSTFVQLDGYLYYNQYFYAKDVDTSANLSDFQISFTNGTATYSDIAVGTSINIPLDELPYGTVDVTVEKIGYGTNTTQIEINGNSTIAYTTYLKKSGLYVTAKDEETYNALTFNITISNSTTSQTWTNQTIYNQQYEDIPTGSITITVKSTDYAQRTYFGTMTEYTALTFSAYLLKETTGHDVSIIILNQNDIPMQTATVTATKFISGAWVTVEQGETDSSGTTSLFLDRYTQYKIKITHGDIITFYRTLTPSANSYTFRVSGQIELNFYNLFEGISYSIIPVQNSILTELTNLSYTVSSATGELEYFGYVVEDNDHNVLGSAVIDSSPGGAEMIYNLDISVLNYSVGDNIYFYTYFKRADTDEATYSRYYNNKTYVIWIYADSNSTIVDALDQFSSENSSELVLLLLATLIMALSLGGLGMMIQRVDVSLLVVLIEMGIFTMVGWIPFFAGSVAGLLGIIILFGYVRGS